MNKFIKNVYKLTFNTETKRWDYSKLPPGVTYFDLEDETVEFAHLSSDEDAARLVNRWNRDIVSGYREIHTCKDCGKIFFINAKEKDWYAKKNYQLPKRCRPCRATRKSQEKRST